MTITEQELFDLLGSREIPGGAEALQILCIRVGELVAMNGEEWVRANRGRLLEEWQCVLDMGL